MLNGGGSARSQLAGSLAVRHDWGGGGEVAAMAEAGCRGSTTLST